VILLGLALVHGLIYTFLIPPWQHYDEPNHFEAAWFFARLNRMPERGDSDPVISRQVVESMVQHGFYESVDYMPDISEGVRVGIPGYSQFDEPPFYYLLVSLPLRLLGNESVEIQLYAGRIISLMFYLLTVTAAWGLTGELTAPGSPLRWLVPLTVALIPSFTDLMTALNNDAAAIAITSCFLWFSVRLLRRRFSWGMLALLILVTALAAFTKSTTLIILPLFFVVVVLLFIPSRWRWTAWIAIGLSAVALAVFALDWGDASGWARSTTQAIDTRILDSVAPLGESVFQIELTPEDEYPNRVWIAQLLPEDVSQDLSHKVVTVGAWMWASRPVQVRAPQLSTYPGQEEFHHQVTLDQEPIFVSYLAELKTGTDRVWLTVQPFNERMGETVTVYLDGLMLLEGEYPLQAVPRFYDQEGLAGELEGIPFNNLLSNPSAESSGLRLKPWVEKLGTLIFPDPGLNSPSVTLYALLDWEAGARYYWGASQRLLRTFWAKFGWGHVPLLGSKPYRPLAALTLLGIVAFVGYGIVRFKRVPWDIVLLLFLAMAAVWGIALIRGSNYLFVRVPIFYPVARYAYPVIIPTVLALVIGLIGIVSLPERWFPKVSRYLIILPVLTLIFLVLYSLISIVSFYY